MVLMIGVGDVVGVSPAVFVVVVTRAFSSRSRRPRPRSMMIFSAGFDVVVVADNNDAVVVVAGSPLLLTTATAAAAGRRRTISFRPFGTGGLRRVIVSTSERSVVIVDAASADTAVVVVDVDVGAARQPGAQVRAGKFRAGRAAGFGGGGSGGGNGVGRRR